MLRLLMFFSLAVICAAGGCNGVEEEQRPAAGKKEITITERNPLRWICVIDGKEVRVNCYLFPASEKTERAFKEWMAVNEKRIESARRLKDQAPTTELSQSYAKEIQAFEQGFVNSVGGWPGWPMVMMYPVLAEKPTRVIFVCRRGQAMVDVAFTALCPSGIEDYDRLVDLMRLLTAGLSKLTLDELKKLPWEKGTIYNSEGLVVAATLIKFADVDDFAFIKQR